MGKGRVKTQKARKNWCRHFWVASKVHVEALAYLVASPLIMMHASATTILHIYTTAITFRSLHRTPT
jgi:hypothetical protein